MRVNEHRGETLKCLAVEPDGYSSRRTYPMVVLLHGYGANMGDLANLCPAIDQEGYVYICPNGPLAVWDRFGSHGYSWIPPGDTATPEDVQRTEKMLATLLEEVMELYGVQPGELVLGGFSQGGMMIYSYGLANPHSFRGLFALSAKIVDPEGLRARLPPGRTQPIFVSHGTSDTMIPVEDARDSLRLLEGEGYKPDYREYSMGHEINQDVLDDLAPWLRRVLPPVRSSREGRPL